MRKNKSAMDSLDFIDVQIIHSMLTTKPVEYIAMIIDKPPERVEAKINELVSSTGVIKFVDKKHNLTLQKKVNKENAEKRWHKRHHDGIYHHTKPKEKSFETKAVDYSQMISVRIDHKTVIYIKPGEDAEQCKQRYLKKLEQSHIDPSSKRYIEVKKLKPIKAA